MERADTHKDISDHIEPNMCKISGKEPRSILQSQGPYMNFHMLAKTMGARKAKSNGESNSANRKRVYLGFLNGLFS